MSYLFTPLAFIAFSGIILIGIIILVGRARITNLKLDLTIGLLEDNQRALDRIAQAVIDIPAQLTYLLNEEDGCIKEEDNI